ncbi:ABC transporter ATP-binding protein [Janibacter melonis]|uniref:ABC transporter ATP-binding protein n=1 Tax=Janibacter melonis TaxID=262209 RepID=UPI001E540E5E|nr:ABC transporter ATP-binding protein [Janibacter melonis]MCB5991348.1 ABC transporter ATP-binding protein [Janibacter melonis]
MYGMPSKEEGLMSKSRGAMQVVRSSSRARSTGRTQEETAVRDQARAGRSGAPLLDVSDLSVEFGTSRGPVAAVNGFDLRVDRGDSVAIVGESGSGKSVAMRAVLGLYSQSRTTRVDGEVLFDGVDLRSASRKTLRGIRGERLALIAQDALSSLNPSLTVGYQISEALRIHRRWSGPACRRRAAELLDMVGIPSASDRLGDYPHQFSGGMRQRVLIAAGLALDPDVLIADEPTTALDVTIQAQILQLLRDLRAETGMALVMITHDMGVVAETADRVAVMYAGSVVESGRVRDVFDSPQHPYTTGLLRAVPRPDRRRERLSSIPGSPPSPSQWPGGCRFHPRCPHADEGCRVGTINLEPVVSGHSTACRRWKEIACDE